MATPFVLSGGGIGGGGMGPTYGYRPSQPIGGALPFPAQQQAGNIPFGGNPAQIAQSYANAYNSALQMNQANYQNVLAGYQKTLEGQQQRQHNTQVQFYELDKALQDRIAGIGNEERQRIQDRYAQSAAAQSQGLIDRGLGNTTVQNSIMKGLQFDEARAQSALAEQIAGLQAGYMRDVGLQRIGQHAQGSREFVDLSRGQLDFMNSVQSPYPDAGLYASLAAQAAAEEEMRRGGGLQTMPRMGGGGVSYGPKDPNFGRPTPGSFGNQAPTMIAGPSSGYGYNSALIPARSSGFQPTGFDETYGGNSFAPPQTGVGGGGAGGLGAALAGAATTARSAINLAKEYADGGSSPSLFGVSLGKLTGR